MLFFIYLWKKLIKLIKLILIYININMQHQDWNSITFKNVSDKKTKEDLVKKMKDTIKNFNNKWN